VSSDCLLAGLAAARCQIAERQNTDETPVAIHDRDTPYLLVGNTAGDNSCVFILKAIDYIRTHNVPDKRVGSFPTRSRTNCHVARRYYADQPATYCDREHTNVEVGHNSRRILDRLIGTNDT
jgi:hypothetical protein